MENEEYPREGKSIYKRKDLHEVDIMSRRARDKVLFGEVFKIKLGSIPNVADPMVEWFDSLLVCPELRSGRYLGWLTRLSVDSPALFCRKLAETFINHPREVEFNSHGKRDSNYLFLCAQSSLGFLRVFLGHKI